MRDVRPRALPPQDKLFDTEDYERSKPAAFLGSSKKRVDEADARAAGLEMRFSAAAAWQYLGSICQRLLSLFRVRLGLG